MGDLEINAYSDLACPWCYVGKRHLDNAIEQYKSTDPGVCIQVHWHPYMIDKNTQPNGEQYMAYNIRRWGGDSWTQALRKSGNRIGLEFKDWQTWPNTLQAHRVVHLAGLQKGCEGQNMAKNVLFRMIYEDGQNVSQIETLVEAAKEIGLENAEPYLRSDEDVDEVLSEDSQAKSKLRISGVPFFIIKNKKRNNRPVTLSGAQGSDQFVQAFHAVMADD